MSRRGRRRIGAARAWGGGWLASVDEDEAQLDAFAVRRLGEVGGADGVGAQEVLERVDQALARLRAWART